ncbi:MAG TPA: discoidin domain-containing protein [Planctomycetota bacterium]|nr:discoidin domain-containing protein [Planctomycetota bacterium]
MKLNALFLAVFASVLAASDYNITLVTDSTPDLTDIDSYLRSITSQYEKPQDKAIAIWRWSQRLRKQNTNPMFNGQYVLDPIDLFNSFGYCNCGIISGLNDAFWLRMGWKAHYVQLGDHTVTECSWNGGKTWHMFDASMSIYCFNDKGEVAGVREIVQNPHFYLENFAPECGTNPARDKNDQRAWRCASDRPVENRRTLANGVDSYKPTSSIQEFDLHAQFGRRYVLNLRPGESYTRYFEPLPADAPLTTGAPASSRLEAGAPSGTRTFLPTGNKKTPDPDTYKYFRANGAWHYAPNLRDRATRDSIYSDSNVKWTPEGIRAAIPSPPAPLPQGERGEVIFKISAANAVTSAKLKLKAKNAAVAVSRDAGMHWIDVDAKSGGAELLDQVASLTEYLVKIELNGAEALLSEFSIDTITQLNRPALPKLVRGPNRVQVKLGPQLETIQFQPSVVGGNHAKTAYASTNIDVDPQPDYYKATLRPSEKKTPCSVTWKIETPTPITDLSFGGTVCVKVKNDRVSLLHSWDDKNYASDFQKTDDALPNDLMINTAITIVPPDTRTAFFRYEFETNQYAKHYAGPGIQMAQMLVHHQPRKTEFAPIEVTYCWIEHRDNGDVERQHTELVTAAPHDYTINVGGFSNPTMKWVRMNLKGFGPAVESANAKLGYSDGQDVGPAAKLPWARYTWGKNLALGKPYTLDGIQDARNPDAGGDLTDGIVAPPDNYVSAKWMPTNVIFAKDVSPAITLDLGSAQSVAAVRVHAMQSEDFHLTFPDKITVEISTDGTTFAPAGSADFKQVFEPPADYAPWELDESLLYKNLPAGGRLAYPYRIIFAKPGTARYVRVKCDARKGWGVVLSEVQVFDQVSVDANVPPLVVHEQ